MAVALDNDCHVKAVRLYIEDFTVIPISPRSMGVTSLIAAVPEFGQQRCDEDNSRRYDIKIRSRP